MSLHADQLESGETVPASKQETGKHHRKLKSSLINVNQGLRKLSGKHDQRKELISHKTLVSKQALMFKK